jgi:hypothetical protein
MGTLHLLSESSTSSERHVVDSPFFKPPQRHACLPSWCPSWRAVLISRVSELIPWTRDGPSLPGLVWAPPAQRTSNVTTVVAGGRPRLESSSWMAGRVIVPTRSSAMSSTEYHAGRTPAWTRGRRASMRRLPHSSLCFDRRSSGGPEIRVVGEKEKCGCNVDRVLSGKAMRWPTRREGLVMISCPVSLVSAHGTFSMAVSLFDVSASPLGERAWPCTCLNAGLYGIRRSVQRSRSVDTGCAGIGPR